MKNLKITIVIVLLAALPVCLFSQPDEPEYNTSPFQMTFIVPPFSTNGMDNANYVNNLSLNLFIGVSGGVDGVELGGFINVDRFFVSGIQLAGFGNSVGGNLEGIQLSGFYNVVGGNARFVQGAGFINITAGRQDGLQGAGFMNVVGSDLFGFQGAGFANIAGGSMTGIQGAGFMNVSGSTAKGIQGAGFMNVASNFDGGAQGAGFANVSGNGKVNLQASGFMNIADSIEGIQAAGFLNRASYVRGLQASGFLNICDSIDGIPIGFISIVKKNGYRSFEVATSETQMVNLSFRMGVPQFYTIYSFGKPYGPSTQWLYGLGFGTQIDLNEKSHLNIEALTQQELWIGDQRGSWFLHQYRMNMLHELRFVYARSITRFADLFIGPTLNLSVAHSYRWDDLYIPWEPLQPDWAFYDVTYDNSHETNFAFWAGIRGGIRF